MSRSPKKINALSPKLTSGVRRTLPIPLKDVLADVGLTMTDWEDMAKTPLTVENRRDGKRVTFTDQAKAGIRAVPQPIAIQVLGTLARFLESGEGNVKRLQVRNRKEAYR